MHRKSGLAHTKIKFEAYCLTLMKLNFINSLIFLSCRRDFFLSKIIVYIQSRTGSQGLFHTHKDKPDPSNRAGVYRIHCECGKVYIGETGRNLPTRLKEHRAHGCRGDFEKSSIVKHSHIKDHQIDWQAPQLITPINSWHTRRVGKAIEIFKHDTVPQDIGFFISDIWRPLLLTEGSSVSKVHNPTQTEGSPTSYVNHPPSPGAC